MNKTKLLLLALCAIVLTGCIEHKIDKGVVVNKSMEPACISSISNGKFILPINHPASYRVSVEDKGIVETFYVTKINIQPYVLAIQ